MKTPAIPVSCPDVQTMARGQGRRGNLTRSIAPPLSKLFVFHQTFFLSAGPLSSALRFSFVREVYRYSDVVDTARHPARRP
jgi:hypothetical protein